MGLELVSESDLESKSESKWNKYFVIYIYIFFIVLS